MPKKPPIENDEDEFLCWHCTSEQFLREAIKRDGRRKTCDFCGKKAKSFPLGKIADMVEKAFQNHFERTSVDPTDEEVRMIRYVDNYSWDRSGDPVVQVVAEITGIDYEPSTAIVEILADRHSSREMDEMSEETDFAKDSYYRARCVDERDYFRETWSSFERQLHAEHRFFSKHAKEVLDEIFEGVENFESRTGEKVVRTIGPETELKSVYRARVFQSPEQMEEALKRPDVSISPPPSNKASAGRMNAQGISVFYGASNPATALAEVRPPVGSQVVVGEFEIIRDVKIIDVRSLGKILIRQSYLDPNSRSLLDRAAFLGEISRLIVQPAMPEREHRDYLVTQVIADYLAAVMELDGIVFPSVQTSEGFNLVLFHRASGVEKFDVPEGSEITVDREGWGDDGPSEDYSVDVTLPEEKLKKREKPIRQDILERLEALFDGAVAERKPDTLRLNPENLMVHSVTSVQYNFRTASVVRRTFG